MLQVQGASFESASVFHQTGLKLRVPTLTDSDNGRWCEHMKLFHCGENFPHKGSGELSILYNFGAFENGRSAFYNPDADTFNAHYGVYAIHQTSGSFGFKDGNVDTKAITDLVSFDQLQLVMTSLGCPKTLKQFHSQVIGIQPSPAMAGFNDWVQIDAMIQTNSPQYQAHDFELGTLQYGQPPENYSGPDFPVVPMVGRLYLRYDETRQITVIYFVIGKNETIVDETSEHYLMPIEWSSIT